MIWITLALFVVSFILTVLLAPKPQLENARADSLNNVEFPRATEDAPIPLILGKVRFNAPNTIWYGDFAAVPIKDRVKTGLFSKETVIIGYRYFLGIDLALCMGPEVELHEIIIDDKTVWTGTLSTTAATQDSVSAPDLFGGFTNGGGFVGNFTYYPGAFDQTTNGYLEGIVGADNVPAYRGLAHIIFRRCEIGESAQIRKMAFVLSQYSNDVGAPNFGKVGVDMNPIEALYQIMTDPWRGLGIDAGLIDLVSFQEAATTLYNEGNGLSMVVTAAATGKSLITEILRHVDGIMFQDPETGKFRVSLVRGGYDVDELPLYDEDDVIQVRNFTKTSWEDVISQVKVSFPTREKESTSVAIAQDMATASMVGRLKTATLSFPLCYSADLAASFAARELSQTSVPLFRATIEMNRSAYALRPAGLFRLNWPEYGMSNVVFRVQKHDLGALMDNRIVLECLQDSFAQGSVVFSAPETSVWVEPATTPVPVLEFSAIEMPYFLGQKVSNPVPDGSASVIPVALKPSLVSTGFDFVSGVVSGTLDMRDPTEVEYPANGVLDADYLVSAGFATGEDATGFVVSGIEGAFPVATAGEISRGDGGLIWVGGEWMSYSGVTGTGSTVTLTGIQRGLFGTTPLSHGSGTRVWHVPTELLGTGLIAEDLSETGTLYYKILDRVGPRALSAASATEYSLALADVADRPLRPRFLRMGGSRTPTVVTATDQALTWVGSNRAATTVTTESASAQTPDQAETYDVRVYFGGVLQGGLSLNGVSSGVNLALSTLTGPLVVANAEVRVFSRRTGGDTKSSAYHATLPFTVNIP